ncbi:Spc98 family-domain-containing protein [Aspergillus pseudoustus]|uniref:Spindle pole body component n=1 Tax=Aspergillus pseudoustus TaxID=1810923 RepID=A0ABR4IYM2_9EURO
MMATADNLKLTERLIAAVANVDKDNPRFRILKRRVDDTLKSPLYGRTDQFAVSKQLDGLQEKFRVLSRDDLADALQPRLTELNEHRGSLFPEVLSLLLQLADRPAQLSRIDQIARANTEKDAQQLTWTDLDASGTAYCDEDIWESVDYGVGLSDDDEISSISSDSQPARSFTRTSIAPEDDYVIPEDVFSSGEDEDLIKSIQSVQFWREDNALNVSGGEQPSRVLTEPQLVRETVFMLQGLPTSLFWRLDGQVELDRRYSLSHLSPAALSSLLRSISICGTKIDILRRFTKIAQTATYMQTFHRSIEEHLSNFDQFLSDIQSRFLDQRSHFAVSLLKLSDDVQRESTLLVLLADLISNFESEAMNDNLRCLDLLYDLVCNTQASGDDGNYAVLVRVFLRCFETYARPIRRWMEAGLLESSPPGFFVMENREKPDLRTLWHDWYTLTKQSDSMNIPKFIRPLASRIFITGKSMVFINRLNLVEDIEPPTSTTLSFEDIHPSDSSPICLPFYALLESALTNAVNERHAFTSTMLRKELDERCGLWTSLQALEHIYLCKDMSMIGPIDTKIFELIDRGKGGWNDRFLLTELAQSAFSLTELIDPTRLVVRSTKIASSSNRARSVKLLNSLSFDYILPWPVANIITKNGITAYQRISTFLMQVRRAKYTIVKQRLQYSHIEPDQLNADSRGRTLSYALRHNMLWFLNTFYSHLTDFVISSTTESLRKALSTANDVDAMIAAHRSYMESLEEECLLSSNLNPLYQAILTILDLCIAFADLQASRSHYQNHSTFGLSRTPRKQVAQSPFKPMRTGLTPIPRKTRYEYSYGDEEDSDDDIDDDENDSSDDENAHGDQEKASAPRHGPLDETQYVQRLNDIQNQFNHLIAFMAAGLKGVGRVDGQVSWEMLAEKLEWRKEKQLALS